MKKRIISLLLVAVMAVLALAGCAYSYEKDDMAKYADFNKAEFLKILADGSIKITDADFGIDEEARQNKVLDTVFTAIAKNVGTDTKVTEGIAGKYDVLYYCYYTTATVGGTVHIFDTSKMTESKPTSLQLGLSTNEGLNAKIAALFAQTDVKDYIYTTVTADDSATTDVVENKTEAGDVIYVSYTKQYTELLTNADGTPVYEDDGVTQKRASKTVTVTCEKVTLNGAEGSFLANLVGKTTGSVPAFDVIDSNLGFATDEENTVNYTNVTIQWIVGNEKEIGTVDDTPYNDVETKLVKDIYGKEVELKGATLTYHVFPVYLVAIGNELTAEMVLEHYYNSVIATEEHSDDEDVEEGEEHEHPFAFDSLQNGGFKNGEKTLAELCKELATLRDELTTAEKERDDAKSAVDKAGSNATKEQETALSNAEADVTEIEGKIDTKVTEILGCTNDKGDDVKAALVNDLKAYQYESLEKTYENAIKQSLAKEVYELAKKYITYKTDGDKPILPKKAVREAYERIENNHKYNFYEGKFESEGSTSSSESNYKHYHGDFDEFLKVEYFGNKSSNFTVKDARNKMQEEAEQSVRDIILIYSLAEALGEDKDLSVTDKQIEDFKYSYIWYFYGSYMSESDYKPAMLLDNVINYLLEENEDAAGNKVDYVRVKYDFKAEDDAEESGNE